MKEIALVALITQAAGQLSEMVPRRDGPNHLQFISIDDRAGTGGLFMSNTVDKSCIEGPNAICEKKCGYVSDSSDYYGELQCRFCLIRWKCLNLKTFRNCGKARCSEQCDEEPAGPKDFYGIASQWRQQDCLACMIKEECATEFDLRLHYGFTRNCVGECVSKVSESCPSLPIAERCSYRCHDQCKDSKDQNCFGDCLRQDDCTGMQDTCINCIQSCAAAKIVIQESEERSLFDLPTLKAHFTPNYMKANNLVPQQSTNHFGREREEEDGESGKKKNNRRRNRTNRRKDNDRGKQKKNRKRGKKE